MLPSELYDIVETPGKNEAKVLSIIEKRSKIKCSILMANKFDKLTPVLHEFMLKQPMCKTVD